MSVTYGCLQKVQGLQGQKPLSIAFDHYTARCEGTLVDEDRNIRQRAIEGTIPVCEVTIKKSVLVSFKIAEYRYICT